MYPSGWIILYNRFSSKNNFSGGLTMFSEPPFEIFFGCLSTVSAYVYVCLRY